MEENEFYFTIDNDEKENLPNPAKKKRNYSIATKMKIVHANHLSSSSGASRDYGIARQVRIKTNFIFIICFSNLFRWFRDGVHKNIS